MPNPQNFLSPVSFEVAISRLPNVSLSVQSVSLPGLSAQPAEMGSPFKKIYHTQDTLTYEQLTFSFIINEDMDNYIELMNWLVQASYPENYNQFKTLKESDEGIYSDIALIINNSTENANIRYKFEGAFPINLSNIELDLKQQDIQYAVAEATFQTQGFTIEVI